MELHKQVKQFHTDRHSENMSKKIAKYVKSAGIVKEATVSHALVSNGVVESADHKIKELVWYMLGDAGPMKKY